MTEPRKKLERTLGLGAALSIGTGTMIGAGLFVFPGIAAGKAGPAAVVSFAVGGLVALLVAACTAELATAMPRSGGPYHYVSQVFGTPVGFVVGVCQTAGLVFASAFYLVAFSRYLSDVLSDSGLSPGDPVVLVASGAALLLTGANIVGTGKAAKLQNSIVIALATILVTLFCYGLLRVTGVIGAPQTIGEFAPNGVAAVLNTAALVFVSYLGFVQIATVAGEIKRPERNLPLALLGSVILVTMLYVLTLYVSTRVMSSTALGRHGEAATVEVARHLIGGVGATVILGAGALAALSSANASILSASRTLFAMGKDNLAPASTARVNDRFNTPHIAVAVVGIPIVALVFLDDLEPLAEIASALHLVIYAVLCAALPVYRSRAGGDANDRFRLPFPYVFGLLGALACAGLLFFMQTRTQFAVLSILLAVIAVFLVRARILSHDA